jgi:hypothetical protein
MGVVDPICVVLFRKIRFPLVSKAIFPRVAVSLNAIRGNVPSTNAVEILMY